MGVALTPCTVPARGEPTFNLAENEIEVGIGIHGEAGRYRKNIMTADEITEMIALSIIEDQTYTRSLREWDNSSNDWNDIEITSPSFKTGDHVLVMVNNMGGTPLSELYIIYRKLADLCQKKNLVIIRNLVGTYITSLEMQGLSITILKMDDEMTTLWDAPVNTPSLHWGI